MSSTSRLNDMLVEEYALYETDQPVDTSDLARAVLKRIDPMSISPELVDHAAFLELKQLARAICRRRQQDLEDQSLAKSGTLFDFKLQDRYPQAHDGEDADVYLPLSLMREADFHFNSQRLRREASGKIRHADALDNECKKRFGMLSLVK